MARVTCDEGRKRLDTTLASSTLSQKENVRRLVKQQILKSDLPHPAGEGNRGYVDVEKNIDTLVEKHSNEIWDTLEMVRSASDYGSEESKSQGWKLKQDTDQLRVMYREGPKGTLFHTLLAEGYINGPLDSCLCVGLESTLYPHWWPQFTVPAFKIIESRCLKRIRVGEELSLVRVKVPWPLASREVVFRFFELEYFEENIVIVLLKSVPDAQINNTTYGFNSEDIPPIDGTVRMDLMGGFALQKVNSTQSYFRTVANLDIKLDFVPPWLINFISRQLIGHGFKLYQKTVLAASNNDENFKKIIEHGIMYIRIREGLQAKEETRVNMTRLEEQAEKSQSFSIDLMVNNEEIEECKTEGKATSASTSGDSVLSNVDKEHYKTYPVSKQGSFPEIHSIDQAQTEGNMSDIDPEIQKALKVLDNVIAFVRTYGPGTASLNQTINSVMTTESQSPSSGVKRLSDSLSYQYCNRSTEIPFLPECKVLEKHNTIEGFSRNPSKIENVDSNVPRESNVKSNRISCFPFRCFSN